MSEDAGPDSHTSASGRRVAGRYLLLERLGAGGMAVVHRAWDTKHEVVRAVKLIHHGQQKNQRVRERFRTEAKVMARLHHPNIVQLYEDGEDGREAYLVMEFCPGGSVWDRIEREGPLPPRMACGVIAGMLGALGAAHDLGVVHRDVKPHNVLLDATGQTRVADFGIARRDLSDQTRTGVLLGTIAYMPPEQKSSARRVDGRADLYAVSATLYALLTGSEPFDLFAAHLDPRARDEFYQDLPEPLVPLLLKGSAFQPDGRFPTAAAMSAALVEAVAQLPVDPETPPLVDPERVARWDRSRPWLTDAVVDPATPVFDQARRRVPARPAVTSSVSTADRDASSGPLHEAPTTPYQRIVPPAQRALLSKPPAVREPPQDEVPPATRSRSAGLAVLGCGLVPVMMTVGAVVFLAVGAAAVGWWSGSDRGELAPVAARPSAPEAPAEPKPVPVDVAAPEPDAPRAPPPSPEGARPEPAAPRPAPVGPAPGPVPAPAVVVQPEPTSPAAEPQPEPTAPARTGGWTIQVSDTLRSASLQASREVVATDGLGRRPVLRLGCRDHKLFAVLSPAADVGAVRSGPAHVLKATIEFDGGGAAPADLALDTSGRLATFPPTVDWLRKLSTSTWFVVRYPRSDGTQLVAWFTNEGAAAVLDTFQGCGR